MHATANDASTLRKPGNNPKQCSNKHVLKQSVSFPLNVFRCLLIFAPIVFHICKGIFAAAQIVPPKDCKGDKFCEIAKMILGPTVKWFITGHFEWKKLRVATGFANIRLWDGLFFHKLELYVEVGPEHSLVFDPCRWVYILKD